MENPIDTSFKKIRTNFYQEDYQKSSYHEKENEVGESIIHKQNTSNSYGEVTSVTEEPKNVNYEDSEGLIKNIFRGRDFITSESWDSNELIKSRIVSSDNDSVYLDCIIDIETMDIQHREFPKSFFSNFKTLETGDLALIKIKSKPGSYRIDVFSGQGIINPELFDFNGDIEELKGRDLGTKLRKW